MPQQNQFAPGWPGIAARWTSSAKTGVGTAQSDNSHVWFTLSHGIFNEIYYPSIDKACTRDMGLIVTNGTDYFSEEKRNADSVVRWLAEGVPAFGLINTSRDGRYRIEKEILTDPRRNTVLQQTKFVAKQGKLRDFHIYVILAPHLGNFGAGNTAWVGKYEGTPLLFAEREGNVLALACSAPWIKRSAGFAGTSDGWQDIKAHNKMEWEYTRAENGNIALTGEIDLANSKGKFLLALGFGTTLDEAANAAIDSLQDGFAKAKRDYIAGWKKWIKTHSSHSAVESEERDLSKISLAVLRLHESKTAPGAIIASLAIPWGFSKGDNDLGGYHLVWSRDMVETAGGLLAAGAHEEARRVLSYLEKTQLEEGRWPQNMWLDGSPYWNGIQMDETALPIILVDLAYREKALLKVDLSHYWTMIRKAAGYLVRNGPVSPQDRWEEDPGYSPFTVGAEIASLLAAAEMAELNSEPSIAHYLRETADAWYDSIDRWMLAADSDWCKKFGVKGYYERIAPVASGIWVPRFERDVHVENVPSDENTLLANHLVSPDALALVRFGVRAPGDARIRDTAKVIDALLKIETPAGETWHRYNHDGYGEHRDGQPFDGTGIGRGWPLLTGERAHFELAAGRTEDAKRLLLAMETFANDSGLISEQIWDSPDIPERELFFGKPSGSAMPLVWAHAEYLKLRRSLRDGFVFDMPQQTVQRYLTEKNIFPRINWRFNHKLRSMPAGKILRIEVLEPATIHWSADDWKTTHDISTHDTGLGIHFADLATASITEGQKIEFTFYWPNANHWEGTNFTVFVVTPQPSEPVVTN